MKTYQNEGWVMEETVKDRDAHIEGLPWYETGWDNLTRMAVTESANAQQNTEARSSRFYIFQIYFANLKDADRCKYFQISFSFKCQNNFY